MLEVARRRELEQVAAGYQSDARTATRRTDVLYAVMILLLAAGVGSAIAALLIADSVGTFDMSRVGVRLLVPAIALVSAIPLWVQAERHRRNAAEARRLELQFRAFEPYLDPFSEKTKTLMRAALAARLFSRVIEDQDPTREPLWPQDVTIAAAQADEATVAEDAARPRKWLRRRSASTPADAE
ncbi:MAG TPA: hypothetical protein VGK17_02615 [Propionicimonas sp.]